MKSSAHSLRAAPVRVLIADDHALVREGIRKVLALDKGLQVVGEAAAAADVTLRVEAGGVDLVLLDLLMPGSNQMELVEWLVEKHPAARVLVLTMHSEPHVALRAIDAGASGYLTKDISPELLIDAIHRVAAGQSFVDPSLSAALMRLRTSGAEPLEQLSARERQVLVALVHGTAVNEIALKLSLAPNTVSTYKARLMEKLGQESLSDLVRYALRHGLDE